MSRDQDQDWLDALAGRQPRAGASGASLEAELLRDALRTQEAPGIDVAQQDLEREQRLIDLAREQGILASGTARPAPRPAARRLMWWPSWGVAFAAILAVAIGLTVLHEPPSEREVVRGPADGALRISSEHPEADQRELLQELRAAGVEAVGYQRFGRYGIDADLPKSPDARILAVLARHGLPTANSEVLRVEFEPARR